MSEPPDRRNRGTTFSVSFTVSNQARVSSHRRTRVRFFLVKKAGKPRRGDIRLKGSPLIGALSANQDSSRRFRVRIPTKTPLRLWFLVGCASADGPAGSSVEHNNCDVSGQRMRILRHLRGLTPLTLPVEYRIDRFTLPIGRPTIKGLAGQHNGSGTAFGDSEKSDQRKDFAHVGPVHLVADCKRTTNGDGAGPDTTPTQPGNFDQDGDEAKVLIYTDKGNVTFNSMGNSSRRNIPPGEGSTTPPRDNNPSSKQVESIGGEGKHMAIAAARDPEQTAPENDWVTAYKVGSIYIATNDGTEMIFTGYAGIDVFGVGNNCAFGGVLNVVKV